LPSAEFAFQDLDGNINPTLLANPNDLSAVNNGEIASLDLSETPGRTLAGRLTEGVWSALERFKSAGAQDWVVRIRTDNDTALHVRLVMQDSQLVVHAKLESGNLDMVARSWGDLQVALADRGVQVRALDTNSSFSNNSGNNSNQAFTQFNSSNGEQRQTRDDSANVLDVDRFIARGELKQKPSSLPSPAPLSSIKSRRALETWA
jgi:hypothetical protein